MRSSPVLLAILLPAIALAQEPQKSVFPYPVHSRTLANGLDVHVIPMPTPGVAAAYVWMDVGSRDEVDAGRTGFAHFFEHLLFYGTPTVPREARERQILLLGADENAWTWYDETAYHAMLSTEALPKYLALQADNFQHLALTEEDIRREAGAVFGEYRKGQADPSSRLMETLYGTAFTKHTYGHDTIGYEADIQAMPTAFSYSQGFFSKFYRPENATVVIAGDADPEKVFAMVESSWSGWARGTEQRPVIPVEPPQKGTRRTHVAWATSTAPQVVLGWKAPPWSADREAAALDLASQMLLSEVGPLRRRLVEEEGLAYAVTGGRDALVDVGLFIVNAELKDAAHLDRAEQIVREEVAKLGAGVDPALLTSTRARSRYGFLTSLDDPDTVASVVGSINRRAGSPAGIEAYWAAYDAVTAEEAAAAARKWLVDDTLTIVTLSTVEAK